MLAHVLDEVLDYQPSANSNSGGSIEQPDQIPFFDMPIVDGMEPIPTESENFLNWLDNVNWNNRYVSQFYLNVLQECFTHVAAVHASSSPGGKISPKLDNVNSES